MLEFAKILVGKNKYSLRSVIGKIIIAKMICNHPELTNKKVKKHH